MPTAYITAPRAVADDLASLVVGEGLAACVNVVDCASTYRWEGEVHRDDECILFAKTTDAMFERLADRVTEAHPHEVPCIERFAEDAVSPPFARWRAAAVDDPPST